MSLGFLRAGITIAAAYDNWKPAISTYAANFNHPIFELDLANVDEVVSHVKSQNSQPGLILGGPPCQDFSLANNRKTKARANLTISFAQIAIAIRPSLIVMENVYKIEGTSHISKLREILSSEGYGISSAIIDASRVGVPQMRRRFFLVASLDHPDGAFEDQLKAGLSDQRTTVRDYFGNRLPLEYYYAHPRNYLRRGIFSVDEPAATIRRVNRPLPKNYRKHPADKADPSPALRALTTTERAELQTFPADFFFSGSGSEREQQIGNAVPVKLAEYVARAVLAVKRP